MIRYTYFIGALVVMSLSAPIGAAAYNPENLRAQTIANQLAVFTIETTIWPSSNAMTIPVRGSVVGAANTFGFELFSDTSGVDVAGAFGMIIADAPIKNGFYHLPTDRNTKLTILVLAVPTPDAAPQQLKMRLTSLPFGDTPALNASELARYVTPKTTLQ